MFSSNNLHDFTSKNEKFASTVIYFNLLYFVYLLLKMYMKYTTDRKDKK